jgi:hypothetical protein
MLKSELCVGQGFNDTACTPIWKTFTIAHVRIRAFRATLAAAEAQAANVTDLVPNSRGLLRRGDLVQLRDYDVACWNHQSGLVETFNGAVSGHDWAQSRGKGVDEHRLEAGVLLQESVIGTARRLVTPRSQRCVWDTIVGRGR